MARIPVFAVPGPSAVVAALSVAGIASDRFAFEGFPPAQRGARRAAFIELAHEPRTLVFYESPHRLAACLADLAEIFGDEREATLVREITKRFEEGVWATLGILRDRALAQEIKGECVLVIAGAPPVPPQVDNGHLLSVLLAEIPLRQAVDLAVQLTGCNRKMLYAQALALKANAHSGRET